MKISWWDMYEHTSRVKVMEMGPYAILVAECDTMLEGQIVFVLKGSMTVMSTPNAGMTKREMRSLHLLLDAETSPVAKAVMKRNTLTVEKISANTEEATALLNEPTGLLINWIAGEEGATLLVFETRIKVFEKSNDWPKEWLEGHEEGDNKGFPRGAGGKPGGSTSKG